MASDTFMRRIEEKRKLLEQQESQRKKSETDSEFSDLVPESPYERSEEDKKLDQVIDDYDIIAAYNKWCGKMHVVAGKQTEGIKISCPNPAHPDKHPSAWINTDKQLWTCGACGFTGGDKYDIAAWGLGFPVPGYKPKFHELKQAMAKSLGYSFFKAPGMVAPVLVSPEPPGDSSALVGSIPATTGRVLQDDPTKVVKSGDSTSNTDAASDSGESSSTVTQLYADDVNPDEDIIFPTLDWRKIVSPDSFIGTYMQATEISDVANEYHFWNALLAVGFTLGRETTLFDQIPIYGNLFICTIGHTGSGKSQAKFHLDEMLDRVMPHDWKDPASKGVRRIPAPASAESLIHQFMKPVADPTNPKVVAYYAPVRGIVDFNELSSLTARADRQGNVLKPTLMQFYDMEKHIGTGSITSGTKMAEGAFASVLTTTQPRALKKIITKADADSGFLNRWVFVGGPEKKRVPIGGIRIDTAPADPLLKQIQGEYGFGEQLQWTPEGNDRFSEFFHQVIYPMKRFDDSGMLARLDLLLKKLCLLLGANKLEHEISLNTVNSVILMWDYIIGCYAIPSAQIGNTLQNEVRVEILRHAERLTEKSGRGVSLRDLNMSMKRKKYPLDIVVRTLKLMTEMGELSIEQPTGPGRPTVRYKYVG